jgi:hypothetical protein
MLLLLHVHVLAGSVLYCMTALPLLLLRLLCSPLRVLHSSVERCIAALPLLPMRLLLLRLSLLNSLQARLALPSRKLLRC